MLVAPQPSRLTDLEKIGEFGKTCGLPGSEQGMTTHQTHQVHPAGVCEAAGPPLDVVAWRACRLADAGFRWVLADSLARTNADLHQLLSLVDAGCPPDLAARILAPIDEDSARW